MDFILIHKSDTVNSPFNHVGITEEQIGQITQSEEIFKLIVTQYLDNLRMDAYAFAITSEKYAELKVIETAMYDLLNSVQWLGEAKAEFDRQQVIKEAEEKTKSNKKV